jgi:prepilin-type processing-associated H-X9-DG protein
VQYAQDYDEYWPNGQGYNSVGWAGELYTYVKSTGAYKCPDDATQPSSSTTYPVSYAYNSNFSMSQSSWPNNPMQNGQLRAPASTVVLAEVTGVSAGITTFPETGNNSSATGNGLGYSYQGGLSWGAKYTTGPIEESFSTTPAASYSGVQGLHTGGSNYLMADGHVKWFQGQQVSGGLTAPSSTTAEPTLPIAKAPYDADGTGTLGGTTQSATSSIFAVTFSPT